MGQVRRAGCFSGVIMACCESWVRTRRKKAAVFSSFQQGEPFWAPAGPVCWNPVPPSPYGLDQLALAFSVAEREVKRTIPRGLEGRGLSHTHSGRLPGSSLSHFTSTWLGRLVIQTLHAAVSVPCRRSLLAKFSMTCCSHPHRYQTQGWTGNRTGQSQLWLVLLVRGGGGGRLLDHASDMHGSSVDSPGLLKEFEFEVNRLELLVYLNIY